MLIFYRGALLLAFLSLSSCASLSLVTARWVAVDSESRQRVSLDEMADALCTSDVVFLGEEHDNSVGHKLQFELTRKLQERRTNLVVALEMFERDVDFDLEDYLNGKLTEEAFLELSRPWGNYKEHYRPVVEWAKRNGIRVVAANIPRPAARRVAYEGIGAVRHEPWMPSEFDAPQDEYYELFVDVMGGHRSGAAEKRLENWYRAQCVKDEVMAESILRWTGGSDTDPLVVHWCGKFHSDRGLGTAARVLRRVPELEIAVVSMRSGPRKVDSLSEEEWSDGDYIWLVPYE